MRAYHVAVRGFNFKLMTYQKVISAPFSIIPCLEVLKTSYIKKGCKSTLGDLRAEKSAEAFQEQKLVIVPFLSI